MSSLLGRAQDPSTYATRILQYLRRRTTNEKQTKKKVSVSAVSFFSSLWLSHHACGALQTANRRSRETKKRLYGALRPVDSTQ